MVQLNKWLVMFLNVDKHKHAYNMKLQQVMHRNSQTQYFDTLYRERKDHSSVRWEAEIYNIFNWRFVYTHKKSTTNLLYIFGLDDGD